MLLEQRAEDLQVDNDDEMLSAVEVDDNLLIEELDNFNSNS